MPGETYYALVASLPKLPHFEEAEWLPVSRKQLDQRLTMLNQRDWEELRLAEALSLWQRQPIARTTDQLRHGYRTFNRIVTNENLRDFVDLRMSQRTALVALRRQRLGLGPPADGEPWGVGPWVRRIEAGWERPGLGLGSMLPWVEHARTLLDEGNAVELERLLMNDIWQRLSRLADAHPFRFEQVFAFTFRWDVLQRWRSYDTEAARTRFQDLIQEVTRDHQQLFT